MNKSDDFYIGWKDQMPSASAGFLKRILMGAFLMIGVLLVAAALYQRAFNEHVFELGRIVEINGTYYNEPVPFLVADIGELPVGLSNHILLVGYGKFGAEGIINTIEERVGKLDGKKVRLSGTLIHGDGKTLMELTREEQSLISLGPEVLNQQSTASEENNIVVFGEILDPKCYFGVMKPGEGKIHKSCAIRCISGGIPPVLRHEPEGPGGPYEYYILVGPEGEKTNKDLLDFVAERVQLKGVARELHGWKILYTAPLQIQMLQ